MTCNEAKKISLASILDKIGAKNVKQTNREIWYISPFRNECTASFKIDVLKNLWYDHGEGKGGNVLDFVMIYYKCDLKEVLQILNNEYFSFHQSFFQDVAIEKEKNYEIRVIKPLTNIQLINYIQSRCIDLKIAKKYCVELHYKLNDKLYYGIGFKNDLDGYEVRNKYIKICLGKKFVSTFINNKNSVIVLESWTDFLSFLVGYPHRESQHDYVILNSTSLLSNKNTFDFLNRYSKIICLLDQDENGRLSAEKIISFYGNRAIDGSVFYNCSKDINDYLVNRSK
ncbi:MULTISPECIES: toprim domain-containing protein [unclassified Myroides]|uniref:toprim domain-containing protein n=1 Tax=unclassified Myroides TaxID=2642485 RepID=UPI003101277E